MARDRKHRVRSIVDPVLIVGTLLSVALGVVFYVRPDVKTAFGVFAGLLGVAITAQIQSITMERRRITADGRQRRILESIDSIPWLPDVLDRILQSANRVEASFGKSSAANAFRNCFETCLATLADLERGHFAVPYGDASTTNALTASCKKTFWATSVQDIDQDWWTSPKSRPYWNLQQEAIKRGVQVTRVFIYRDLNAELRELSQVQRDAGVTVMLVQHDQLPSRLRTDMVIWDSQCAYETRNNASGEPVVNFYTVSPQDVLSMVQQFQHIISYADRPEGQE